MGWVRGLRYATIGEQVGMAQRMESVAPPSGVMLSASTARLVEGAASLGELELVQIKGAEAPVPARRLLGIGEGIARRACGGDSGRSGLGDGRGRGLVRPCHRWPWRGNGRGGITGHRQEPSGARGLCDGSIAGRRGVHRLLRISRQRRPLPCRGAAAACNPGVGDLDASAARTQVRARVPDAEPEDLVIFDDLLGIADPEVELPRSIRMPGGGG